MLLGEGEQNDPLEDRQHGSRYYQSPLRRPSTTENVQTFQRKQVFILLVEGYRRSKELMPILQEDENSHHKRNRMDKGNHAELEDHKLIHSI